MISDNTHHRHGRSPSPQGGRQVPQRSLCELVRLLCNPLPITREGEIREGELRVLIKIPDSIAIFYLGSFRARVGDDIGIGEIKYLKSRVYVIFHLSFLPSKITDLL